VSLKPKVALSQDLLATMSKLPSSVQGKVLKWAPRFQSDPMSPGINYEKIQNARDPNIKSVRIDQDWRGIVFKPSCESSFFSCLEPVAAPSSLASMPLGASSGHRVLPCPPDWSI